MNLINYKQEAKRWAPKISIHRENIWNAMKGFSACCCDFCEHFQSWEIVFTGQFFMNYIVVLEHMFELIVNKQKEREKRLFECEIISRPKVAKTEIAKHRYKESM